MTLIKLRRISQIIRSHSIAEPLIRLVEYCALAVVGRVRQQELKPRPMKYIGRRQVAPPQKRALTHDIQQYVARADARVADQNPILIGLEKRRWSAKLTGASVRGGLPGLTTLQDVVVMPRFRAVFDQRGHLIDASLRRRSGRTQLSGFKAPCEVKLPRFMPTVSEPILYVGTLHRHFGHFLLEGMARLWPLLHTQMSLLSDVERRTAPVFHRHESLAALNLRPADLLFAPYPTRVTRLLLPEPSYEYGSSAFWLHRAVFGIISERLAKPTVQSSQPVYFTREYLPSSLRTARAEQRLTQELARHGFRIVSPERLSFSEQVRVAREHATIVGLTGSALHLALFSPPGTGTTVHLVAKDSSVRSDYPLVDTLMGRQGVYIACTTKDPRFQRAGNDGALTLDVDAALSGLEDIGLLT